MCHKHDYHQTERGPASTEAATDRDSDSSSFFRSFHICTFFISGWCDLRGGHGAVDARLDTLNDQLCQVNTRVGRIVQQQARLGGFVESPSPSPEAFEDEDDDGDSDDDDDDGDEDASLPSDDEMTA